MKGPNKGKCTSTGDNSLNDGQAGVRCDCAPVIKTTDQRVYISGVLIVGLNCSNTDELTAKLLFVFTKL